MKSEFSSAELKLKSPFCMTISGQSGAGKSTVTLNLLRQTTEFIAPPPKSILYCYGVFNSQIPQIQQLGIQINNGLPSQQQLDQAESHMEEVRTRDARFTASDEAWKEEMRGHYRKHDTIEQERLTLDRENADVWRKRQLMPLPIRNNGAKRM